MDVWRIPEVCVVHLKRFSSFGGVLSQKNSRPVKYPMEIDFKKWVLGEKDDPGDCKYRLCGTQFIQNSKSTRIFKEWCNI